MRTSLRENGKKPVSTRRSLDRQHTPGTHSQALIPAMQSDEVLQNLELAHGQKSSLFWSGPGHPAEYQS